MRRRVFLWGSSLDEWLLDFVRPPVGRWQNRVANWLVERTDVLQYAACAALGHAPVHDHCGMPEHDLCAYCNASMPGAA